MYLKSKKKADSQSELNSMICCNFHACSAYTHILVCNVIKLEHMTTENEERVVCEMQMQMLDVLLSGK